ncbi:MAG TPA: beta-propeller fold lactonase family protein, partial [Mycobacteriales bacterium]|nr:beta-propeller fold lactonase family protein [Mycobacteriales bacterium]
MRRWTRPLAVAALAGLAALGGSALATVLPTHAGPAGDGTGVTPVGFRVTPAGRQTGVGGLPLASAVSPDGRTLLVVDAGDGVQAVKVIDTATSRVRQSLRYFAPGGVYAGAAFSPDGRHAYVSGGGNDIVRVYDVQGRRLAETTPVYLPTAGPGGEPLHFFPSGLAVTPDGGRLVVADQMADAVSVVDLSSRRISTVPVGHRPRGVAVTRDGGTAYVSNQGGRTVSVLDLSGPGPVVVTTIRVGTHPNALLLHGSTLFVSDGDSDQVSVIDASSQRVVSSIPLAPYLHAPVGANPDALAVSPGGRHLYVANSGDNDVAVVDVRTGTVTGLIPTAWYPTSVQRVGDQLYVLNAKGLGVGPNLAGPNPWTEVLKRTSRWKTWIRHYVGAMLKGTLSTIPVPDRRTLDRYTTQVGLNDGLPEAAAVRADRAAEAIVPRHVGDPSPIKHVIYVVKENRTYDQELGSLGKGNGDPRLNLFGDDAAPNTRALARRFVDLDNFYANAEVSAQGWNWDVAANSNPFTEHTWSSTYSGRNLLTDDQHDDPATAPNRDPADAYIWDRLADAHISFRNYGFYTAPDEHNRQVAPDPRLDESTDDAYRDFDLECPDSPGSFAARSPDCGRPRFSEWKREFDRYVRDGDLPTVEFVRLPSDHTAATAPELPTPTAYVADNDWALGRLVDTVSHSPYWKDTAIFVTE